MDEAIVLRAQAGDREAFGKIYEIYHPLITKYCVRLAGSDGEDIAQDVFISAMSAITQTKPGLKVSGWLHRIAINRVIDASRRAKRVRFTSLEGVEVEAPEDGDFLVDYYGLLTDEEARVIRLRYRDMCPLHEIRETTGLSDQRVRNLLRSAEQKIREVKET